MDAREIFVALFFACGDFLDKVDNHAIVRL